MEGFVKYSWYLNIAYRDQTKKGLLKGLEKKKKKNNTNLTDENASVWPVWLKCLVWSVNQGDWELVWLQHK